MGNNVGNFPSYDSGTIVSVFEDYYYPQDAVLPFDPMSKIRGETELKFPLTQFAALLPCRGRLSLAPQKHPNQTSILLESKMRRWGYQKMTM